MSHYTVTFVGDMKRRERERNDPETIFYRGLEFTLEVPVHLDVTTPEGKAIIAKLKANHHFKVVEGVDADGDGEADKPAAPKKKGNKAEVKAEAGADGDPNA